MNFLNQFPNGPKYLDKILDSQPSEDNYAVYGKNCVFKIENWGNVKMLFAKFTITPDGDTPYAIPTAPYLIENAFLECNGVPFARVNTTYTLSRIDSLQGSGLYDQILNGANLTGTFNATSTITLPLFFFAIDGQQIDPSKYKNLTIRIITKRDNASMGFVGSNLTNISIKLTTVYEQRITKEGFMISPPPLSNFYNITSDTFDILNGTTSKVVKLNSPSRLKSLIFMIRRNADASLIGRISSVSLRFTNGQENVFENSTNYLLTSVDGTNDGSTFKIDFGDTLKINRNMNPLLATVNYTVGADSTLFIVYEYESVLLEENGFLLETFPESIY